MRITGGRWRGRRVDAGRGRAVRPTTDRVREALFNVLRDDVPGAAVADCCCGSGALGLEALSRGAARVDFVDVAPAALRTVRANLDRLGADPSLWRLHRADAARWLARRLREAPGLVVLADPPYGGPVPAALLSAAAAGPAPVLLVLEHPATWTPPAASDRRWHADTRRYGGSAFTVFRPLGPQRTEAPDG